MKKPSVAVAPATVSLPLSATVRKKIEQWQELCAKLSEVKASEIGLRKELASLFFPSPKEGTNRVTGLGFETKLVYNVTRNLDQAALDSVMPQLPEEYRVMGNLIRYGAFEFSKSVYEAMPADLRKIFDQALEIKDGAPSLEITLAQTTPPPVPAAPTKAKSKPAPAKKRGKK